MMSVPDSVFCPRCNKRVWLDVYREFVEAQGIAVLVVGCPNAPCKCNVCISLKTGAVSDLTRKSNS